MPFPPRQLPSQLETQLDDFLSNQDFPNLYKAYSWERDTYDNGFPDILSLEERLGRHGKMGGITLEDVKDVARWGGNSRNVGRMSSREIPLSSEAIYTTEGILNPSLQADPTIPVFPLDKVNRLGPTSISKVLRFTLPEEYGAIDTRILSVFGQGDADSQSYNWISLQVRNYGYGPVFPSDQKSWPSAYGVWIDILRYFVLKLPASCPHPQRFIDEDLRESGKWTCADVEMALFAYASDILGV